MKDRIPRYPNRVRLTPVSGQANVYDLVRADSPTEEGTPLNKSTLLTDDTASLLGLSGNPTVNDALNALADRMGRVASGVYSGTGAYGQSNPTVLYFPFKPQYILIHRNYGNQDTFYAPGYGTNVSNIMYATSFPTFDLDSSNYKRVFAIPSDSLYVKLTENEKGIMFYSTNSQYGAELQFNNSNGYYRYLAIG